MSLTPSLPGSFQLASDEVHLWCARLDVPPETSACLYATLTPDERTRSARFQFERDQQRFIVARGVLRDLLGRYLQIQPGKISFVYNAFGKPDLGPEFTNRLKFNLSHSAGLALIAIATASDVGVDLEYIRAQSDCADIARRFFSAAEVDNLNALPSHLYAEAFFSCWTKKEACLKAHGEGLAVPLNSFSVPLTTDPAHTPVDLYVASKGTVPARRWSLYTLRTAPGYAGALAIEGTGWRLRQWQWKMPHWTNSDSRATKPLRPGPRPPRAVAALPQPASPPNPSRPNCFRVANELTVTRTRNLLLGLLAPTMLAIAAGAEPPPAGKPAVDKSGFNLFNPTPTEHLRAMDRDGPGTTESPYTVDAGHFQVELTLVAYTHDRESFDGMTQRSEEWEIGSMNLKLGLLNQLDAQLVLEPYNLLYEREDGSRVTRRGFGDTTLRLKYNFWGNDGGRTAFAATPYVKFPTSQEGIGNRGVEGGLVLPLGVELPSDFWLGWTPRFDAVRNEDKPGYHAEFVNSVEVGHDLFGNLSGYLEFFSAASTERDADWEGTFDPGLIYEVTENLQFIAGVDIGVTRSADDWAAFLGLTWRY